MRQGFDSWFGLPFSHDMRMTVPRDNGLADAPPTTTRSRSTGTSPLMRNGEVDRAAGRSSHADHGATPKRRSASSSANKRSAVLPLPRALAAAHPAGALGRVRRPQRRRASTATSSRRSTGAPGASSTRCAPPASTGARWSSSPATTGRGCRSRRTAARPGRCARARGRPGRAACARRRSSGGPARYARRSSPTSARRWICSSTAAQARRRGAAGRSRRSTASTCARR